MASSEKALADKVWMDKRFAGARVGGFDAYLLDDLRIDGDALSALDLERLAAVARAYDSSKIDNLLRFLNMRRAAAHA